MGHVFASAAAAHGSIASGVVNDHHGDGSMPQAKQPVANEVEGIVVVLLHAKLGGAEVVDDEEAFIWQHGRECFLVLGIGNVHPPVHRK